MSASLEMLTPRSVGDLYSGKPVYVWLLLKGDSVPEPKASSVRLWTDASPFMPGWPRRIWFGDVKVYDDGGAA